ncbi:MAG: hypothetical protein JXR70_06965 [Spirochaetales bacterium]|nr:hypothetical protein [Spirochaetales bacterium]
MKKRYQNSKTIVIQCVLIIAFFMFAGCNLSTNEEKLVSSEEIQNIQPIDINSKSTNPSDPSAGPGYNVQPFMIPENIELVLETSTPLSSNYRYIVFENKAGTRKYILIRYTLQRSYTNYYCYSGQIATASGLASLAEMVQPNNRSYWDKLYFYNNTNYTINLISLKAKILYDDLYKGDFEVPIMRITNRTITAFQYVLDTGAVARRMHINEKFGWTDSYFLSLPYSLRTMVYDLGKSGSSDASDSTQYNPKYGLQIAGNYYCGETIIWYFCNAGIKIPYKGSMYDFQFDTTGEIGDYFQDAGLRYDYDPAANKWYYMRPNGTIDRTKWTTPKPGDYLGWYHHHGMMLLNYDAANKTATVMDGPYPVNYWSFNVADQERNNGTTVFIGRIPANQ